MAEISQAESIQHQSTIGKKEGDNDKTIKEGANSSAIRYGDTE